MLYFVIENLEKKRLKLNGNQDWVSMHMQSDWESKDDSWPKISDRVQNFEESCLLTKACVVPAYRLVRKPLGYETIELPAGQVLWLGTRSFLGSLAVTQVYLTRFQGRLYYMFVETVKDELRLKHLSRWRAVWLNFIRHSRS